MMEPAQNGTRPHLAERAWVTPRGEWRLECQAAVRPLRVVVGHVLLEHGSQVPLIEDEYVVQALVAQGAHHPLGDRVRFGARSGVSGVSMPAALARGTKSPP